VLFLLENSSFFKIASGMKSNAVDGDFSGFFVAFQPSDDLADSSRNLMKDLLNHGNFLFLFHSSLADFLRLFKFTPLASFDSVGL